MDNKGEDLDLECKTPEKGKLPLPRLVELPCLLVITSSYDEDDKVMIAI